MEQKAKGELSERLVAIPWVVDYTGLSHSGIRRLVRRGTLPAVRIGRRILFRPASIARFIEQRELGGDVRPQQGRRRQDESSRTD